MLHRKQVRGSKGDCNKIRAIPVAAEVLAPLPAPVSSPGLAVSAAVFFPFAGIAAAASACSTYLLYAGKALLAPRVPAAAPTVVAGATGDPMSTSSAGSSADFVPFDCFPLIFPLGCFVAAYRSSDDSFVACGGVHLQRPCRL
jgi:hypothetical protein